ncbi:MAG: exosortase/archaeosortase family protein, partial [Armatimonadota bacterium]
MTHTDAQATPAGPAAPATGTGTGGQSARLLTPLTAVVAVLLLACFAPYLGWMWDVWMRSPYYGHGPLIPLVSAYLVYSRRRELRQAQGGHHLWGLPIVILGLLVYAVAIYLNVNFPQGFALIAVVGGLTLLLFGWERARTLAFPILYLSFMVPLDLLLVTRFSSPMQLGGAAVA